MAGIRRREALLNDASFCEVTCLYRDAANFKCWGSFVVKGDLSVSDLTPHLIDGEFFIPSRIGIPDLTPEVWTEFDHEYHEIDAVEWTAPAPFAFSASHLVELMRSQSVNEWRR